MALGFLTILRHPGSHLFSFQTNVSPSSSSTKKTVSLTTVDEAAIADATEAAAAAGLTTPTKVTAASAGSDAAAVDADSSSSPGAAEEERRKKKKKKREREEKCSKEAEDDVEIQRKMNLGKDVTYPTTTTNSTSLSTPPTISLQMDSNGVKHRSKSLVVDSSPVAPANGEAGSSVKSTNSASTAARSTSTTTDVKKAGKLAYGRSSTHLT